MSWVWWAVLASVWALGLAAAINAIMRSRTPQGGLAWALMLLGFPPLALPLYMFFGDRRFVGYQRGRRRGWRKIDLVRRNLETIIAKYRCEMPDARLRALIPLAQWPALKGNLLKLFTDGDALYREMASSIDEAKHCAVVQFYIFADDASGRLIQQAVIRAAKRGVKTLVLFDEAGCWDVPWSYFRAMREAGAQISGFRSTVFKRRKPFRINFRNHRKIVVVDGRIGFFGGFNVGEEYCGRNPDIGPWRDTHVRVDGPAALCLQMSFLDDWSWAQDNVPELCWDAQPQGETPLLIIPSGPADMRETAALMFLALIERAEKRLWFAGPYFVPDETINLALQSAALRGVDVRAIMPRRSDSRVVDYAKLRAYEELLPTKVRLFEYVDGFMHQKVMLSDDVACVGSANIDNRSMRINFELSGVTDDKAFVAQVEAALRTDLARSVELTMDTWKKLNWRERFLGRLASLVGPML